MPLPPRAVVGGLRASDLREVSHDASALDRGGRWAVVLDFEGRLTAARFDRWEPDPRHASGSAHARASADGSGSAHASASADASGSAHARASADASAPVHPSASGPASASVHVPSPGSASVPAPPPDPAPWPGVPTVAWSSSLDGAAYRAGVAAIRDRIAAGDVYQVNLCRTLASVLPAGTTLHGLHDRLADRHPAPHAAHVFLPDDDIDVACASPELFVARDGDHVVSRPIKGTAPTAAALLPKDRAENVMIVDLVRNDLGRVCVPGTVRATEICAPEEHPGLVHLVSTVEGRLRTGVGWAEILDATFPAGSIVGAPKLAALDVIAELEPTPRGPYCGAIGWIDADRGTAELAVGIRTFWRTGETLRFGTGGGITWDSDPDGEWRETELKAARLLAVAAGD